MVQRLILPFAAVAALALCFAVPDLPAQPAARVQAQSKPAAERFEFEVVQSFQAKYEGDTPGHIGRNGGLGDRRPRVALGDPVFRGEQQIGRITELGWSRVHGSLEVEFDPLPAVRICVGDQVWLYLEGPPGVRQP
jgi:hypothetical protein